MTSKIMSDASYCYYCSTDTEIETETETTETEADSANGHSALVNGNVNINAQVLKTLPTLVVLKPRPKQPRSIRPKMLYQSTKDISMIEASSMKGKTINTWKGRLLRVSNIASLLCVVDCTILPVVTLLLPLIGLGASPEQEKWLHHMGHKVAMNFVLPIGGLTATINYTSHKNISLSLVSLLGLILISMANASCHSPVTSVLPHYILHLLHGGLTHRCVNISGCALLILANYLGHKTVCYDGGLNGFCCFGRRRKIHQD